MAARLGEVFSLFGQVDQAIALFVRVWQFAESKNVLAFGPQVLALLGDAYWRVGRMDEAVISAQRALALARQLGQRNDEAWALYISGNIQSYGLPENENQRRDSYEQSLKLARALGMRPLEAQCHLALGQHELNRSNFDFAQRELNQAVMMFGEMGMQGWQQQARTRLSSS
jgi:tetratricopeptide (TPR) repeat protein